MSSEFDPYRIWLSIPANEQPANYYRLLGVDMFESDDEVISSAADRQMTHVRSFQSGEYSEQAQKILKELAIAQVTLLNKTKKSQYDAQLRSKINASSDPRIDDTIVVELPPPPPPTIPQSKPTIPQKKKISTKSVKKKSSASKPLYVVILLSAIVIELFLFAGFYLYLFNRNKQQPSVDILAKAESLYNQSVDLEKKNKYSEALSKMNYACQLFPKNEEYRTREGLLRELVNEKKTEELYKQAIELESNKEYSEALSKMNYACQLAPENEEYESARQRIKILHDKSHAAGARKTLTVNGVEFVFRKCPPGTFLMGSPKSEEGRQGDETQHQVTLTKGFWIMETEVTQKQWKAVMGNNPSTFKGDDLPVERVSWEDCQDFCTRCTELGLAVQLPEEVQWEYACRAGTTGDYKECLDEIAWYESNSSSKTHPVGTKKPNAWGLYDMIGNVWEWCVDKYLPYPKASVTDPPVFSEDSYPINRGGSWYFDPSYCRPARRGNIIQTYRCAYIGFRCVLTNKDVSKSSKTETSASTNNKNELAIQDNNEADIPDNNVVNNKREVVTVNGVEFAFRWCPPGTFMMGSPDSEEGRNDNETQHQVTLTKGFWIMETEVTQKQWKAIMESNSYRSKYDELPVDMVSWRDCQDFIKKCSELGFPVQLPTESQWEYACRAGSKGAYAGKLDEMAWYKSNSGDKAHPVGTKTPNAWGLYDMYGNVYEWCQDWYNKYPSGNVQDPVGSSSGSGRIIRGGAYYTGGNNCRSAFREGCISRDRSVTIGFRCVITQEQLSDPR